MKCANLNLNPDLLATKRVALPWVVRLLVVSAITGLLFTAACKNDERILETERVRKLLTGNTWVMERVTIDGADQTNLYAGLTLHFTTTDFTTTNGGTVWPASGQWEFADETGKVVIRSDDIEITIQDIQVNQLVFAFHWPTTTFGPGRLSSIEGQHVFTFVR